MNSLSQKFNAANNVIIFTLIVFGVTQGLVYGGIFSQSQLNQWLCVPQQLPLFLERPWTLFTYRTSVLEYAFPLFLRAYFLQAF